MVDSTSKLLELVNTTNQPPKDLTFINVTLGTTEVEEVGNHNTKLRISGVPGRSYRGYVDIFYRRLLLSILDGASVRSEEQFTPQSLLDVINARFNLFITLDDLEPFTLPELNADESVTITLTAKSSSIGFVGSQDIVVSNGKPELVEVVSTTSMLALEHPADPVYSKTSSRMITWGIDFTSLRDAIQVDPITKSYKDWDRLQAACAYLGIPGWDKGVIVDKSTADVPDSNPDFDRVVIQSVVTGGLVGPLYFHYNLLDGA